MKKRASGKKRGARKSGRSRSTLAGVGGPWISWGLVLRGVLVFVMVNLGINIWLSVSQPFSAWRLLTFRHLPARMEAVWYYSQHVLPTHTCGMSPVDVSPLIRQAARNNKLDPAVFRALVEQESRFDPHAISPVGAMGLTQLMPATATWLKVKDPFDPAQNLDGGARYLKELLGDFRGNTSLALAAYNAGPGAVRRFKGIPPYGETRHYVRQIMARADVWRGGPVKARKQVPAPPPKTSGTSAAPSKSPLVKSPPPATLPTSSRSDTPPPASAPVVPPSPPTPAPAAEVPPVSKPSNPPPKSTEISAPGIDAQASG